MELGSDEFLIIGYGVSLLSIFIAVYCYTIKELNRPDDLSN
jgi:hypothetical protein